MDKLDQDQIEELFLAVIDTIQAETGETTLFAGHVWTDRGAVVRTYEPYLQRYGEKPFTFDRLSAIAGEYGQQRTKTFLFYYSTYRRRDLI